MRKAALSLLLLLGSGCTPALMQEHQAAAMEQGSSKPSEPMLSELSPSFLFLAAQNAMKEGDIKLATQLLEALTEKDPVAIDPQIQLTGLLLQQGRVDEAEKRLSTLLANDKLAPEQQERLTITHARLQLARNHAADALAELERLLARHPAHVEARDLQVRALSSQHRYTEALSAIATAITAEDRPEFRLLQAQIRVTQGHDNLAAASLEKLLKLDPSNENGALMLASLYMKLKQEQDAEALLRHFVESYPQALRSANALGKLLVQQQRLKEATAVYRDLALRSGNNPEVLHALGMLYFRQQAFEEAEATFRTLLELQPSDSSRFLLAGALEARKQHKEARALYLDIQPGSSLYTDAQIRLAALDFEADDLKSAADRLKQLILKEPDNMEAHLMLSGVRLAQNRYQSLIDETDSLMTMAKVHPQILFNRSVAFEHFKRYGDVEVMLKRLLNDFPKHAEALNFLGYTYALQGIKLDEAEQLIRRALVEKHGDGYYLDSLAWVYFQRGNYTTARTTQQQAMKAVNDDPVMYEHYGDILWRSGDQDAARKAWRKSIELHVDHPHELQQKIDKGLP